jgi:hypothetical protein
MVQHHHIRFVLINIFQSVDGAFNTRWHAKKQPADTTRAFVYPTAALIERIGNYQNDNRQNEEKRYLQQGKKIVQNR